MSDLTLFYGKGSCAFVPQSLILHLNIPAKFVEMKDSPDGFRSADGNLSNVEYRKIHPQGFVPALQVGNEVITEVSAILVYIASLADDKTLLAQGSWEEARLTEWLVWLSDTVHGAFAMLYRPRRYSDDPDVYETIRKKGRKEVEKSFLYLESRLRDKDFPFGNRLTIVDFYLYVFGRWCNDIGIDLQNDYPYYFKHFQRWGQLNGIKQAVELHR